VKGAKGFRFTWTPCLKVLFSLCLRLYLKTIASKLVSKLAAGPPGRPAKLVFSPAQPPRGPVKHKPDKEQTATGNQL